MQFLGETKHSSWIQIKKNFTLSIYIYFYYINCLPTGTAIS